jgi:hypothetical protein
MVESPVAAGEGLKGPAFKVLSKGIQRWQNVNPVAKPQPSATIVVSPCERPTEPSAPIFKT